MIHWIYFKIRTNLLWYYYLTVVIRLTCNKLIKSSGKRNYVSIRFHCDRLIYLQKRGIDMLIILTFLSYEVDFILKLFVMI